METVDMAEGVSPSASYINALASAGYVFSFVGNQEDGVQCLERCLVMHRASGNLGHPIKVGIAYGLLIWDRFHKGDYEITRTLWAEALDHAHQTGDQWNLAMQLVNMGKMAVLLGEFARAQPLIEDALAIQQRIGPQWGLAKALNELGYLSIWRGEFAKAEESLAESQAVCQAIGSQDMLGPCRARLRSTDNKTAQNTFNLATCSASCAGQT